MTNNLEIKLAKIETSLEHMSKWMVKIEQAVEKVAIIIENQKTQDKKIQKLEDNYENLRIRVRTLEAYDDKYKENIEKEKILEERVEKLEKWYLKFATIVSVIVSIVGFFGFLLKEWLSKVIL